VAVKQEPVYFGAAGNVHLDDEIQVESEQPLSRILAAIICVAVKVEKVKEEAAPSLTTDGVQKRHFIQTAIRRQLWKVVDEILNEDGPLKALFKHQPPSAYERDGFGRRRQR
jgi:hypothetical protein